MRMYDCMCVNVCLAVCLSMHVCLYKCVECAETMSEEIFFEKVARFEQKFPGECRNYLWIESLPCTIHSGKYFPKNRIFTRFPLPSFFNPYLSLGNVKGRDKINVDVKF